MAQSPPTDGGQPAQVRGPFPRLSLSLVLAYLFVLAPMGGAAQENEGLRFSGRVVGVTDGDTIVVLSEGKVSRKIRLHAVDCPESRQAFGKKAKQLTSDLCFNKEVTVRVVDTDRYGRLVGLVFLPDGRLLNEELVRAGLAWWYRKYAPKFVGLGELEEQARAAKLGLWADNDPIPPWDWRRGKKAAAPAPKPPPPVAVSPKPRPPAPPKPRPATPAVRERYCCKVCTVGCACGNSCISCSKTCRKGQGCACNGW
ncbi:MAG TPA: thermonuclease family protein [Verrucomicrobiota bacterium]|nr:thermonuclease family protein [Verrucomicrobiota bacterium]